MSELPDGAISLEDDPAPPQLENTAPPPVEAPAAPPNPDDADPEGVVVNQGGEKLVPLSALVAERQAKAALKAENATLRPKAEQAENIAREWQAVQPIIQRAQQQQQPPPKPAGPLSADEAVEYARDLDLFTADGKPDVDRAQRLAARHEKLADRQAQAQMAPLLQHTAQGQSRNNFEQAAAFKDAHGHQIDRGILETVWNAVPSEMSAQPQIAAVLYRQALAETVLAGKYRGAAPPPPPPVTHTESLGGGNAVPQTLNSIDHQFRQASDMSEKQFTAIRSKYQPGGTNSLE